MSAAVCHDKLARPRKIGHLSSSSHLLFLLSVLALVLKLTDPCPAATLPLARLPARSLPCVPWTRRPMVQTERLALYHPCHVPHDPFFFPSICASAKKKLKKKKISPSIGYCICKYPGRRYNKCRVLRRASCITPRPWPPATRRASAHPASEASVP